MPPEKFSWKHLYSEVVTSGLCTGCAGCVIACPHDVLDYDDTNGRYKPIQIEDFGGPGDCSHGDKACTSCTRACPRFRDWETEVDEFMFGRVRNEDELSGIYKDIVLARAAGINLPAGTQLLFAETDANHPFVVEEQMMPFIPITRVKNLEEGVARSLEAEHGYKHTSIIHSHDLEALTAMGRALDTTLFIKNGPCMSGLGLGGEGYLSFSIATPTGEGVSNPRTFTRVRRCVMVDNLKIY